MLTPRQQETIMPYLLVQCLVRKYVNRNEELTEGVTAPTDEFRISKSAELSADWLLLGHINAKCT